MNCAFTLPASAILGALALDVVAGDPPWLPHPVRLIGRVIALGESWLWRGTARHDFWSGSLLTVVTVSASAAAAWGLVTIASTAGSQLGLAAAVILGWSTLALRGLDRAAWAVENALERGDLSCARHEIRALVGRDPDVLDAAGLIRGAVESVAENCSDGVIAPLFYLFVGGPVAALAYKAINTLDSMIGYDDDRYRWFGRSAARLDDLANLLPARVTALCLVAGAGLWQRSRPAWNACCEGAARHRSPNAGYPEAAMAGALGIQLGGDALYGGVLEPRAVIGRAEHEPVIADIRRARIVMRTATILAFFVFSAARYAFLPAWH